MTKAIQAARVVHHPETRKDWLVLRKSYVTATDWPKIQGTSKFGKASDVLMDKLGLGGEIEETTPMKVGKLMEPYLKMFVPRPGSILYSDPDFIAVGRAGCSPDLTLLSEEVGEADHYELKVSTTDWDGIPPGYQDQGRFQMAVLGLRRMQFIHGRLKLDYEQALTKIQAGTLSQDDYSVELLPLTITDEEAEAILEAAETWFTAHVELGLPLPAPVRPAWTGVVENQDLAGNLLLAIREHKDAKARADAAEKAVNIYKRQAEEALGAAKALMGAKFAITRSYVAGRRTTDHEAVLRGLRPVLNPEQLERLTQLLQLTTTVTGAYTRWSVTEEKE